MRHYESNSYLSEKDNSQKRTHEHSQYYYPVINNFIPDHEINSLSIRCFPLRGTFYVAMGTYVRPIILSLPSIHSKIRYCYSCWLSIWQGNQCHHSTSLDMTWQINMYRSYLANSLISGHWFKWKIGCFTKTTNPISSSSLSIVICGAMQSGPIIPNCQIIFIPLKSYLGIMVLGNKLTPISQEGIWKWTIRDSQAYIVKIAQQ